ncbi:MAG: Gfo/Idh/MocA family oxidoreductase [Planctomycetota bacterium]|nr:Gfo/Idh/MocA family oxidoreductase [Planctomycetota bacterium]MDP7248421.1 Gfo/Idh/MocA family oxidoreductase [Planctomycetota bacterium]
MSAKGMTRREAITKTAAALSFTIVPRYVLGGPGYTPPSDVLTKAIIGVGGMGRGHFRYGPTKTLAVCEVDNNRLKDAVKRGGKDCKGYKDFREVLARDDIDTIHIPTPPHWHALISIAAAEAGKDIWCEKPMSRTIAEGKKVVEAVQRNGRIFRLNTWFRFQSNFYGSGTTARRIKKAVESGLLGWPIKVTIGGSTGFNWKFGWSGKKNLKPVPVPAHLDYDMWLGPAPYKPYNPARVHGVFRGYWDYDGGGLGDMGQHYLDPIQYIMGKDDTSPIEIEGDAPPQHPDACGSWRTIWMKYADGCELILDGTGRSQNAFIQGPKGRIDRGFRSDIPDLNKKLEAYPEPEPQVTNFVHAVKTRQKFALNESNGHRSCTIINLGKIAVRLSGRKLRFDPVKQEFINDPVANAMVEEPMRAPWNLNGGNV